MHRNAEAIKQVSEMTRHSPNKCGFLSTRATIFSVSQGYTKSNITADRIGYNRETGNTRQRIAALLHLSQWMTRSTQSDNVCGLYVAQNAYCATYGRLLFSFTQRLGCKCEKRYLHTPVCFRPKYPDRDVHHQE